MSRIYTKEFLSFFSAYNNFYKLPCAYPFLFFFIFLCVWLLSFRCHIYIYIYIYIYWKSRTSLPTLIWDKNPIFFLHRFGLSPNHFQLKIAARLLFDVVGPFMLMSTSKWWCSTRATSMSWLKTKLIRRRSFSKKLN